MIEQVELRENTVIPDKIIKTAIVSIMIGFVLGFLFCSISVVNRVNNEWKTEAIKRGYAEYTVENDYLVFKWIDGIKTKE